MKNTLAIFALIFAFTFSAVAETPPATDSTSKKPNAQQERMKDCNQKATGKKGDERKAFMSQCLSGSSTAATPISPQERMKKCNADASQKALKGDDRKKFMSQCLKAS